MSRGDPGDGEGQEAGRRKRTRTPRPSPSQLSPEDAFEGALAAALRLLGHRERSRAELRARLASKGYHPSTVIRVLDRLKESGLQDDRRFAEVFAEAQRGRGLATRSVQGELRKRGIDADRAAEAATEPPEEEEERARDLARRRAARLSALPPESRYRRLMSFLARRGYPAELCRRLAAEAAAIPDKPDPA